MRNYASHQEDAKLGLHYFLLGWRLIFTKGIKRYVILPLLANIVVMGSLFYWLFEHIHHMIDTLLQVVPGLSW